jgi:hypothetical protein
MKVTKNMSSNHLTSKHIVKPQEIHYKYNHLTLQKTNNNRSLVNPLTNISITTNQIYCCPQLFFTYQDYLRYLSLFKNVEKYSLSKIEQKEYRTFISEIIKIRDEINRIFQKIYSIEQNFTIKKDVTIAKNDIAFLQKTLGLLGDYLTEDDKNWFKNKGWSKKLSDIPNSILVTKEELIALRKAFNIVNDLLFFKYQEQIYKAQDIIDHYSIMKEIQQKVPELEVDLFKRFNELFALIDKKVINTYQQFIPNNEQTLSLPKKKYYQIANCSWTMPLLEQLYAMKKVTSKELQFWRSFFNDLHCEFSSNYQSKIDKSNKIINYLSVYVITNQIGSPNIIPMEIHVNNHEDKTEEVKPEVIIPSYSTNTTIISPPLMNPLTRVTKIIDSFNIPILTAQDIDSEEIGEINQEPELTNDLAIKKMSIIAARILAIKKLLGKPGTDLEDEQLLEIANSIHYHASTSELSELLYKEEINIWADQNGANSIDVDKETIINVYQETWSLMLNPPVTPNFKNRTQIRSEIHPDAYKFYKVKITPDLALNIKLTKEDIQDAISREIYYEQFSVYINNFLSYFCTGKAIANAMQARLGRILMEYKPTKMWIINDITKYTNIRTLAPSTEVRIKHKFVTVKTNPVPALLFPMPDNRYGLITPEGDFQFIDEPIINEEGRLLKAPILRALQIPYSGDDETEKHDYCMVRACKLGNFRLHSNLIEDIAEPLTVKQLMEQNIKDTTLAAIKNWKENNYNGSTLDKILKAIIPFYELIHNMKLDPTYEFHISHIAFDLLELGLTIATIGSSVLTYQSIKAAIIAAKLAKGASVATRASIAIKTSLAGFKTSSFLILTGKELTDFIIPIFTIKNMLKIMTKPVRLFSIAEIERYLGKSNLLQINMPDSNRLLSNIYQTLEKTYGRKKVSAIDIQEFIDEGAEKIIPEKLYRGQKGLFITSEFNVVTNANRDDYLVAIIKHVSMYNGSNGVVKSLSMNKDVAKRFKEKYKGDLLSITANTQDFRTIENILKYDGPRLIREGKIKAGTVLAAIRQVFHQEENEVFYMLGSIPEELIEILI